MGSTWPQSYDTNNSYPTTNGNTHSHTFMDRSNDQQPPDQFAPPMTSDPNFDILEWHPAYQSCQRYFLDHAQHEPATQALCALINIRLPFQWVNNPITSSTPPPPGPQAAGSSSFTFGGFPAARASSSSNLNSPNRSRTGSNQTPAVFVSLVPYIRRLVVTAFDKPPIVHGLFGDDYICGVLPHLDCERRNYLFAAKHGGWRTCKKQYDTGSGGGGDESVPFMKPLDEAKMEELTAAEKAWSGWLAMEDWMVGPRAPAEQEGGGGGGMGQERMYGEGAVGMDTGSGANSGLADGVAHEGGDGGFAIRFKGRHELAEFLEHIEKHGTTDLDHYKKKLHIPQLTRQELMPMKNHIAERLRRTDDALQCVFETYELVEMIMLELPMADIMRMGRVNKALKALVERSQPIRRALLFLPDHSVDEPSRNEMLVQKLKPRLGLWSLQNYGVGTVNGTRQSGFFGFNLSEELPYSRAKPLKLFQPRYPTGSWRAMKVFRGRPSCVYIVLYDKDGHFMKNTMLSQDATMGDVEDAVCAMYTGSVASEDWRRYVNYKRIFKKIVG